MHPQLLTRDYSGLPLNTLRDCWDEVNDMYGDSIAWLYKLRSSELFLHLWRQTGCQLLRLPPGAPLDASAWPASASRGALHSSC